MFARAALRTVSARSFSTSAVRQTRVAVLGAGGGIGQPLSLLLKSDPLVSSLSLYDIRGAPGVAADVSHVDTASEVKGYAADQLDQALEGAKVVVIPAGVPRKPGMTRDDLFNTNASIVRDLAAAIGRVSPEAHILIISNPVNSTVPIVAATLEKQGKFDPRRVFGVTTLDVVRAARFVGEVTGKNPLDTPITVVGGHSGPTIVPLLSQSPTGKTISGEAYGKVVHRIQYGGDEVVKAKDGAGSATLSMAYAGAKFTNSLLRGLNGEKGVITPTFVKSPLYESQGIDFFSSNVELGTEGVAKIHPIGEISAEEQKLLEACLPELKKNIEKGKAFVAQS
ncbi:malate dehydrogenase [Coprinopsis cinerea okayama7|uniref:Malate dehydrogenase n=1 Tax=Coprinopsis cinerea (strain Okayama-7 / 130 / ATCC MYA-4618 / FGSC 9003) TaxID=240176 RepID=A8P7W6_COPC7|nr:malate dehydrogenase [Coprinopsis cinerea okayama7\|eukprot:XP_001839443.1 malate dehydrogenase [Coprinopsis cinerea okayama7\